MEIFGDFGERSGEGAVPDDAQGQGTRQQAADGIESQGSVDAMLRFDRNMLVGCQKGGQGVEVVADDLGADVLLRCKPSQTGRVLKIEAMLDPFVSFLDAPATVIQLAEGAGGIGGGIKQGSHQDADSTFRDNNSEIFNTGKYEVQTENVPYFNSLIGYLARPISEESFPGVIMIHEWWGLNANIKEMAEKLASHGYVVFAVDLYGGQVATTSEEARKLVTSFDQNKGIQNMNSAISYLDENYSPEKIASIGWCFGGGQSLNLALNNNDMDASVIYYGSLVTDTETLSAIHWPVLAIFAELDKAEMTVWSGYKGHGKSRLISQVLENTISEHGQKVFISSPEFPPHRVIHKLMVQFLKKRFPENYEFDDFFTVMSRYLWIYDQQRSIKSDSIVPLCRYAVEKLGCRHILIDSLMKCGISPDDLSKQKHFVDGLQNVAHVSGCHIHLVAHGRKARDDGAIGSIHDIKGTSEIADMVENVIFVWRNKEKELKPNDHLSR